MLILLCFTAPALAALHSKEVQYTDGDTELVGYLYWNDALEDKRPGVMVVHEWWGLNDYARQRAEMLATLGYVAFAVDMYGKDRVTEHPDEAKGWMQQITENVDAWQKRALLGLEILREHELVDPTRTAAIGYCFGGATVMQMAYAGADLKGVVSFHGSLPLPTDAQMSDIKARILVAHGSKDEFVPKERVDAFQAALDKAGADWQMAIYGGAYHSFTVPDADKRGIDNIAYDKQADKRSWAIMQDFFSEVFSSE
jgi:dienelactone hydrolase